MGEMMNPVILYYLKTTIGTFVVEVDLAILVTPTFLPIAERGHVFALRNDLFPAFHSYYSDPLHAILAVANHNSGLPDWDNSTEVASDYAGDWGKDRDERIRMRMLDEYMKARPNDSLRAIVDYFEGRHWYYLERHAIGVSVR